jgi:hypothetical protein
MLQKYGDIINQRLHTLKGATAIPRTTECSIGCAHTTVLKHVRQTLEPMVDFFDKKKNCSRIELAIFSYSTQLLVLGIRRSNLRRTQSSRTVKAALKVAGLLYQKYSYILMNKKIAFILS